MLPRIIPAVIADTQEALTKILQHLKGSSKWVMLDFMDGEFVPSYSLTFPLCLPNWFEYEAHLMVTHPLKWLSRLQGKVTNIIIHVESNDSLKATKLAYEMGFKVSSALNPDTEIGTLNDFYSIIDRVLVMTVRPGMYGAPFVPETDNKIKTIKGLHPKMVIEVDGAINPDNVIKAANAGATIFASGSYIVKNKYPNKAIRELEIAATI